MNEEKIFDYYLYEAKKNAKYSDVELAIQKKENKNKVKEDSDNKFINKFYPQLQDVKSLPQNSTLIKISFTLKKPYTSKDEGEFNVINNKIFKKPYTSKDEGKFNVIDYKIFENPIVRDKFTGLPTVKPTTWKGHLRFAAERVECDKKRKKIIIKRLFGSEPEEKENTLKGRLYFFPTFFDEEAEKEVITPLKRDTRTPARGPIPFEVMKPSKEGDFYLLYFPYPKGDNYQESQFEEDLEFLSKSLELMFYSYGFSAKKTSGFGVIKQLTDDNVKVFPDEKKEIFSNLYIKSDS